LQGLESGRDLAEASHVLARDEHLRQPDDDDLLEPLQQLLGAVAEPLPRNELTPSESGVLQLLLDRLPLFRVPLKAPADLLRELRRALLGVLRKRRPGGRKLGDHLAVPPALEIPPHHCQDDRPAQRVK